MQDYLTISQLSDIFGIQQHTIRALVQAQQIPYTYAGKNHSLRFDVAAVEAWLQTNPTLKQHTHDVFIQSVAAHFTKYPQALLELKSYDNRLQALRRTPKGYSLVKIPHKRLGFVYYVRYVVDGKVLPSKWSTRTANPATAALFALANRERLVSAYLTHKDTAHDLYRVLGGYYAADSALLADARLRGRAINDPTRRNYHNFINKRLLPFLRQHGVRSFDGITAPLLSAFQIALLKQRQTPKTVNWYLIGVSSAFAHLLMNGVIARNVFNDLQNLPIKDESIGCYDIERLQGVFNEPWGATRHYMLNLLIYATGMRNSEIERVRLRDIVEKGGVQFIDVRESKTENGVRLVPLHRFVYARICAYARGKQPDDYLFSKSGRHIDGSVYREAFLALGARLGFSGAALAAEKISFYSGRHYWKTLMNAHELGGVEEYFMGHRLTTTEKRYNHRDKQGLARIVGKAQEVLAVLDKTLLLGHDIRTPDAP